MVYGTKEDWTKFLPYFSSQKTLQIYLNAHRTLQSINSKIKFSNQLILSIAQIYYHKYFLKSNSNLSKTGIDRLYICSACLFGATKYANRFTTLNEIATIIYELFIKNSKLNSIKIEEIKNGVATHEILIMNGIGFDGEVDLPYKLLSKIKVIFERNNYHLNSKKLVELCCRYINDAFILPGCLYFIPDVIAITGVKMTFQKIDMKINLEEVIDCSEYNIDIKDIEECEGEMNKGYDGTKQNLV